jgi:hypothetical protein
VRRDAVEINASLALLNLLQIMRAGIKRYYKAARFSGDQLSGSGLNASFTAIVLGQKFEIKVTHRGEADGND